MKIVQDAPIAVNAREIKSFGSLTDGTGEGLGSGLAQAGRAQAAGGAIR